ncbi:MAG: flagellar basal body rod protein FlgB [Planctomycetaceae bacterium]
MLQPLFDGSTIPLLEKAAVFGERRHDVLAGNIANIDTPNYKTRDLPLDAFQNALRAAVNRKHSPMASGETAGPGMHSAVSATSALQATSLNELFPEDLFEASEGPRGLTFQDANNRSIEAEFMEMTKNSMMQSFAVELMNAQMTLLQAVIREQA